MPNVRMEKSTFGYLLLVLGLAIIAVLSRLLPHPANFTAIGAVALFSGTYLPRRWGIVAPLIIMLVTDAVLGFYEPGVMIGVYGSFLVVGLIGWYVKRHRQASVVGMAALSASIIFFVITNFVVWAFTPLYPHTAHGLFLSYALAVPFFRNMLFGDIIYTAVIFGAYEFGSYVWHARATRRVGAPLF